MSTLETKDYKFLVPLDNLSIKMLYEILNTVLCNILGDEYLIKFKEIESTIKKYSQKDSEKKLLMKVLNIIDIFNQKSLSKEDFLQQQKELRYDYDLLFKLQSQYELYNELCANKTKLGIKKNSKKLNEIIQTVITHIRSSFELNKDIQSILQLIKDNQKNLEDLINNREFKPINNPILIRIINELKTFKPINKSRYF